MAHCALSVCQLLLCCLLTSCKRSRTSNEIVIDKLQTQLNLIRTSNKIINTAIALLATLAHTADTTSTESKSHKIIQVFSWQSQSVSREIKEKHPLPVCRTRKSPTNQRTRNNDPLKTNASNCAQL